MEDKEEDQALERILSTGKYLLSFVDELNNLGLALIQTEIWMKLIDGRRTTSELAAEIYEVDGSFLATTTNPPK